MRWLWLFLLSSSTFAAPLVLEGTLPTDGPDFVMVPFEVPAGTVLARAGQSGDQFFLILDGSARVDVPPRKRAKLKPGDYFGEMSLLDGGPRSATVTADTPLRLLVIQRRDFATLLREAPDLTQSLLATLSRRVRQAEQVVSG